MACRNVGIQQLIWTMITFRQLDAVDNQYEIYHIKGFWLGCLVIRTLLFNLYHCGAHCIGWYVLYIGSRFICLTNHNV